jgi:acetolactate synthase-1/3 small subunit
MGTTLAVLVENKPGVMARVSGLFRRRGFNIESISVGVTNNPEISRMTLVVEGDERKVEQVKKQLNKLVDVIKIIDLPSRDSVERELALVKVKADAKDRSEIMQIVDTFRARIVDVAAKTLTVEVTGDDEKINAMVQLLSRFGVEELVKAGKIAMVRGSKQS